MSDENKNNVDYYADGTPVEPEVEEPSYSEYHIDRRYSVDSDWQRRQTSPEPMYNQGPGKKDPGAKLGIIAALLIVGLIGGLVYIGSSAIGAFMANSDSLINEQTIEEEFAADETTEKAVDGGALSKEIPSENVIEEVPAIKGEVSAQGRSVADVAEEVMPAMVAITNTSVQEVYSFFGEKQSYEVPSAGSGIIVGQTDEELLIATNNHVVSGSKSLSVCFVDDTAVPASIKGTDAKNDLAIVAVDLSEIKEETRGKIRVVKIGDSDKMRIGEQVVAIGNALGYGQSVSAGVVSAVNRSVEVDGEEHKLLQTDAAINPGNSGGALLNMDGELIGINEIKYVSAAAEGIGYAIPITFAKPILDELMNLETRKKAPEGSSGYLGVTCLTVTEQYSTSLNIPMGVYVESVVEGGAAEKAGIRARDIITKVDGHEVLTSEELVNELTYYKAGTKVDLTVSRLGEDNEYAESVIEVKLDKRPPEEELPNGED